MDNSNILQDSIVFFGQKHDKEVGIGSKTVEYMHYHDMYEITLVLSGQEEILFSNQLVTIHQYEVCFIRPFEIHKRSFDDNTSQITIAITKSCFEKGVDFLSDSIDASDLYNINKPFIRKMLPSEMKISYERIKELYDPDVPSGQNVSELEIKMVVINLLASCLKAKKKTVSHIPGWLLQLVNSMDSIENCADGFDALVTLSGKSPSTISHAFKQYYNTTPSHFINEKRIKQAARLLSTTNDEITDIAYECGFGSLSYFYKHFKDTYGVSPFQYRKNQSN